MPDLRFLPNITNSGLEDKKLRISCQNRNFEDFQDNNANLDFSRAGLKILLRILRKAKFAINTETVEKATDWAYPN